MFRSTLLVAFACLVCAASVGAQARVLKTSVINEDNEISKSVAEMVRGKIGGTLRYPLSDMKDAVISIDVVCIPLTTQAVACTAPTRYYPETGKGISQPLTIIVASGPAYYVAQALYDNFVEESADNKLADLEKIIQNQGLGFWIEGFSQGYTQAKDECGKTPPAKKN